MSAAPPLADIHGVVCVKHPSTDKILSSQKDRQWYLGMKAHIGVGAHSGLVHTVRGTSGYVAGVTEGNSLLHAEEAEVFGGAGHQGADTGPYQPCVSTTGKPSRICELDAPTSCLERWGGWGDDGELPSSVCTVTNRSPPPKRQPSPVW